MKTTSRFFAVIFYCSIAIFFAYGCSGNDALFDLEEASRVNKPQYLDVDPPVNGGFSKEQFEILSLAYQRLADYLVIEKDGCYLTAHGAKELNMSDRLFNLMEQSVRNANLQYQMYLIFRDNNQGIIIKNPFDLHLDIALTKVSSETVFGPNMNVTYITLSHSEVTTVINAKRAANGSAVLFAGIITGYFSGGIASAIIGSYAYLVDGQFSNIQDKYAMSGSTSGITLIQSTVWSPTTGMSSTVYSSSINI